MTTAELTFSVVVNTIDRALPLRTLLRSLEHQSYPHFEVIVVVGPTHDNTYEVLAEYGGRVRVLSCPRANLGLSRNIGLLGARGDVVAYIDDDAVPSRRWLEQLSRLFADPRLDATGGVVYAINNPAWPVIQHRIGIISSLEEQVDVRTSPLDKIVPPGEGRQWIARMMGTNMAIRRQALLDISGFDEYFFWLADEAEMAWRLNDAGKIVQPVLGAVVYHLPASSRNRVAYEANGKAWRVATRAGTYFSLKHGPGAGESTKDLTLRALHLFHGHLLSYSELYSSGQITARDALRLSALDLPAVLGGVADGLWRSPRRVTPAMVEEMPDNDPTILTFQNDKSAYQPAIDPVSGRRPNITMPDPPLRICLLSHNYPPEQIEGVGRHTNLMARGLFECGHIVHVVARGDRDQVLFYDGAYVHRTPYGLDRYARYRPYPNVWHALNASHAFYDLARRLMLNDGIQVLDCPLWLCGGLVAAASKLLPVVLRLQTATRQVSAIQETQDEDAGLLGSLERAMIGRASYLVPNSLATVKALAEVYGVGPAAGRYSVIPHGIVPVADDEVRPFDLRRTDGPLNVLYVGRLEKRKGILDLFEAIPEVLKRVPDARFTIAGADNSEYDAFARRTGMNYQTYFARHYPSCMSRVSFLGEVSDEALAGLYQSCDLFVAPSLYESFGLIYTEAMNYAKPVVGCRAGGVPEVVEHGVSGLLADPGAPVSLAEALVTLLKSPALLHNMGLAGRERLLARFTYVQMARAFADVYRQVIAEFVAAGVAAQDMAMGLTEERA